MPAEAVIERRCPLACSFILSHLHSSHPLHRNPEEWGPKAHTSGLAVDTCLRSKRMRTECKDSCSRLLNNEILAARSRLYSTHLLSLTYTYKYCCSSLAKNKQ